MRHLILAFIFTFLTFFAHEGFSQTNSGILGIYAKSSRGSQGGTAFIVSRSGDIVTAYHVVQNAISISIQDAKTGVIDTANVTVRAIDAKRDLAILNVPALNNRNGFELKVRFPPPSEKLRVIGYPRGMPNAEISAQTIKEGPATPANSPFNVTQGPLLMGDIQIIPLDMTIYGGLSGSPLIDKNGAAVGVVSGSLNEGGSFAWAIPISEVTKLLTTQQSLVLLSNYTWPKLELLAPYAKTTARSYTSTSTSFAIRVKYREALAKYLRATEELRSLTTGMADGACSSLKISANTAIQLNRASVNLQSVLLGAQLGWARDVAENYRTALLPRTENSKVIRTYLREIYDLPNRADVPSKRKDIMKRAFEAVELAEPELFSRMFEEIFNVDPESPRNLLVSLNAVQGRSEVSIAEALAISDQCSTIFKDIARYKTFTIAAADNFIDREKKLYSVFAPLVDEVADFLAFK